jgi:hypothetical protein
MVSATQREGRRRARSRELTGPAAGLDPRRGNGEAKMVARVGGRRATGEGWAAGPKAEKRNKTPFLFFFLNISKHFQIILNPLLNLNQTTQYKIFK